MRSLKRILGFMALIYVVIMCTPALCYAQEAQQVTNDWVTKADMSIARWGFKTKAVDGKIYLIGGSDNKSGLSLAEVYNPVTDQWSSLAPMSEKRLRFGMEVINGKIYAFGGTDGLSTHIYNSLEVYEPANNQWTTLSPMLKKRDNFVSAVVNNKIYVFDVENYGSFKAAAEVYDPEKDRWSSITPIPKEISFANANVIEGKIYVTGGYQVNKELKTNILMEYDPATNIWRNLTSMPTLRYGYKTVVLDNKLYALGGGLVKDYTLTNIAEVYDPATNKWSNIASSNSGGNIKPEVVNNKIYYIKLLTDENNNTNLEEYDPITNQWTSLASLSTALYNCETQVCDGKIYALGEIYRTTSFPTSVEAFTIIPKKIAAPTNLVATEKNLSINLKWDAVEGATGYNVKRSETSGGPYTTISSVSGSAIAVTDNDVQNNKTYYYVVTAVDTEGESDNSNEATVTLKAPDKILKLVLEVKEAKQLSVSDELSDNTNMKWISSDTAIASVDDNGLVKALKPGNTIITCRSKDDSYIEKINVLVVDLDYQLAVDLRIGEKCRLTVDDLANTTKVTWTAYDPSIATVTNKGKVTAVSEGLTYITATDSEGNEIGRVYIRVR